MSTQSRGHATLMRDVLMKEIGARMSTQSRGHAIRACVERMIIRMSNRDS